MKKFRLEQLLRGQWRPKSICSIDGDGAGDQGGGDAGGSAAESTAERALEFWDSAAADGGGGEQQSGQRGNDEGGGDATGGQQQGADGTQGEADGKQDANAQQIPDEQLHNDPRYQEVAKFRDEVQPVFDKHNIPDAKEADLQLQDASILYQIAGGQERPSKLLDLMTQNPAWTKEQTSAVAQDLMSWLTRQGFLKGDQAAGGEAGGKQTFADPLEERLNAIERANREGQQQQQQQAETARQSKIFDSFRTKIGELIEAKGLDKEDLDYFGREVRALMSPDQFNAIVGRIEKGNFVDVIKYFDQVANRETSRLKRWSDKQVQNATRRQNSAPRVPAGGAPPAAKAGQQKRNLSNREERLAAAESEWDK